ncbi:MAG: TerB N-terminal domain-containing protein [Defluviitaleaceae bacterium]|nr:TerB N-terminal domain-containing protein [Defluviitaleaceae bacterium]
MRTDNNSEITKGSDSPFVEIELEDAATRPSSYAANQPHAQPISAARAIPAPQAIPARAFDALRARFRDMRRIVDYAPYSYQNDGWLFYEQAKFMADVTDDYPHRTAFSAFYPYYQRMGYEQLRTYFTWRTQVRALLAEGANAALQPGSLPFVGASYLYLYIYELLSCIGVRDPADALDKLQALYPHYREAVPALAQYLTVWARDFHVYYNLPGVGEDAMAPANDNAPQPEDATAWINRSGYNLAKSKFFADGREGMIQDCIAVVFSALRGWCAAHDTTPETAFLQDDSPKVEYWKPFAQALFHPWLNQRDRVKTMPGGETYVCQNNRWTLERAKPFKGARELVGYIIRKTEARLRELNKFKGRFTADAATLKYAAPKLSAAGLSVTAMEKEIIQAVDAFHRELHRVHVNVDAAKLTQIRAEASDTQEKLTVEEDEITPDLPPPPDLSPTPGGWDTLIAALTPTEHEALTNLCRTNETNVLIHIAATHHLMPEVLAEGINEKAFDHIGDNILDDDGTLYEDYLQAVASHL